MPQQMRDWSGALTVMVIAAALVVLDLTDNSVHHYWSRHSFTSSVLSGVLVLLLTVLIVDRVARMRQLRNQSRAIAAQAGVILGQGARTATAITAAGSSDEDRDQASGELRTYMQMLLTSAPVLIEAKAPRAFLEAAQRLAYQLARALRDDPGSERRKALDADVQALRDAAAPLLAVLNRDQLTAVGSAETGTASSSAR